MESNLETGSVAEFLERFNRFFDSVIEAINIHYDENARWPNVNIAIQCQDQNAGGEWVNLVLKLSEVTQFQVSEGKTSYRVLSDGLVLRKYEAGWGVGIDEEQGNASDAANFLKHPFCFFASSVAWEVSALPA